MSIGKNIADYRKRKGFTQAELGKKLGVTNQAVSKWESETSMPDVMMIPRIARVLEITLDDLFDEKTAPLIQTESHVFDMDAVHSFAKDAQAMIIDTICRRTNLVNCNSWDFLRTEQNPSTEMYDRVKRNHTLCCLSEMVGSAFISDDLTMIDSALSPDSVGSVFEKSEIASAMKKLSDSNVRRVLSHICNEYFHCPAPFDSEALEYFCVNIKLNEISNSVGISEDDVLEALEKLISLHIVELSTENGIHYMLHKVKAIEAAVTFRLLERLLHNQVGMGCGEFLVLNQF